MTDIRLLGPVELRGADGRPYAAGPPQQRCVLAVLAMSPGRAVVTETLIGHAWRDVPAGDRRDVLYSYVSRLRRVLRRAGDGAGEAPVIRRESGGYVLDADPADVDVHRARALARRARQVVSGDAGTAAELLGEAVALWRGTPLAGLRGQWAERARAGLQQELITLLTRRHGLELRLGRHEEAVAALSADVVEHPLAEPLTGQLMLALHRSGRQADALQAYDRIRELLDEEIGAAPGPELRRLHERILRRDPGLRLPRAPLPHLPGAPRPAASRRRRTAAVAPGPRSARATPAGRCTPAGDPAAGGAKGGS